MDKIWLIIKREYLTRVTDKKFLLTTLLAPLAMGVLMFVAGWIVSYQDSGEQTIKVVDPSNVLGGVIKDQSNFYFQFTNDDLESLRNKEEKDFDGILYVPEIKDIKKEKHTVYFYGEKSLDLDKSQIIERIVANKIKDYKVSAFDIDRSKLDLLATDVSVEPEKFVPELTADGKEKDDPSQFTAAVGSVIGMVMGFLMYMVIFMNGSMVMRSVMEEKISRIVEVMISTVKPFQLMMGKIIGVGAVGLTQFLIWIVLIPLIALGANLIFGFDSQLPNLEGADAMANVNQDDIRYIVAQAMAEIKRINWPYMIFFFVLFFLGGYLLYSSLFAAVGAAVGDDINESQALIFPITIPVIIALYIMITAVRVPDSALATWSSMFPLFSPIVMPARLVFDPPFWQVVVSVLLLIGTAIFFTWLAARIYRVGILLYGKKASFKELFKWMLRSN